MEESSMACRFVISRAVEGAGRLFSTSSRPARRAAAASRIRELAQQGCAVLLRERKDGPWLFAGAELVSSTSVVWGPFASGVQYGTDSPTGDVDDSLNATLHADGTLTLGDR
jgi:hypothetical protein